MKFVKRLLLSLLVIAVVGGAYYAWISRPIPDFGRQILVFSKTTAYRHEVIASGVAAVTELGRQQKFNVVASEDASLFTDDSLRNYQAVVFLNTTGDVLNDEQQVAFERYIQAGGGFVGIHAAADTEWRENPWYWYQRLVGGVFASHPGNSDQPAQLSVVGEHSSVANVPEQWEASDEWYDFNRLSTGINVLMQVSEESYEGGQMGEDHPIAWFRDFDGGRSFYLGLGHTESTFKNANFLNLLHGGLEYAMGDGVALDYSKSRPEAWRYTRVILDSGLNEPLKLTFSPTGDLYYAQRRGEIMRYDFESKASIEVAKLNVFTEQEYGLIGLIFDPEFEQNNWLYVFRTVPSGDVGRNVLSRFELIDGKLITESEIEMLSIPVDGNADARAAHTGGDMQFDNAGNLWLSTGDDTNPGDQSLIDDRPGQTYRDAGRSSGNTQDLRGKILRIKPATDGTYTIPAGNLFASASEGRPEIYIMGLRNPYTLAYDDRTGTVYWGEVGPDGKAHVDRGPWGFDEINRSTEPGNFGWPYVIADNRPYAYYDYDAEKSLDLADVTAPENRSRNNTGAKILPSSKPAWMYYPYEESDLFWELGTGGRNALVAPIYYSADYADSDVKFPAFMDGKLLISDFVRRWIKIVDTDASGRVETITPLIDTPLSAPLDMAFGPDGALYIVEYGTNWFTKNEDAYLSRIEYYAGDNPPPVAKANANKLVGAVPLETVLDASTSYDRGAGPAVLTYSWQLIENGKPGRELGTLQRQPVSLTDPGEHTIQLTVTDAQGSSSSTRLRLVVGNERPEVALTVNGNRSFFFDEGSLDYSVSVTDLEDGGSETGEIAAADVTVLFDYIGQSEDLARALSSRTSDAVIEGRTLVQTGSDCRACHGIDSVSVGPSFSAVAQRYKERFAPGGDANTYLSDVITGGGSGQWDGGHAMPGHPDLTQQQVQHIVAFIRSLTGNQSDKPKGLPLQGSVVFESHQKDFVHAVLDEMVTVDLGKFYPGTYVLHASYTDKGTATAATLQGSDTLLLRHNVITAGAFDEVEGVINFSVTDTVALGIYRYRSDILPEVYGLLQQIDLTGINTIRIVAAAMKPMMGGGPLELRLADKDSKPVASIEVEASFSTSFDDSVYEMDVSAISGVHDLYFSVGTSDKSGQLAFSLLTIGFVR